MGGYGNFSFIVFISVIITDELIWVQPIDMYFIICQYSVSLYTRVCLMQVVTAVIQAICLMLGYADKQQAFMDECTKNHTQQECQQQWRDK